MFRCHSDVSRVAALHTCETTCKHVHMHSLIVSRRNCSVNNISVKFSGPSSREREGEQKRKIGQKESQIYQPAIPASNKISLTLHVPTAIKQATCLP